MLHLRSPQTLKKYILAAARIEQFHVLKAHSLLQHWELGSWYGILKPELEQKGQLFRVPAEQPRDEGCPWKEGRLGCSSVLQPEAT